MSKLCWLGDQLTFEDLLTHLGFSKQKIKRIGLSKKARSKFVRFHDEVSLPQDLFNFGIINPRFCGKQRPFIMGEEGHLLAVHKPSQVHIHPLSYNEHDNLLSFLREEGYFSYLQNFSQNFLHDSLWDRGLLYRLDYETSGLVLLASSTELYAKARQGESFIKRKVYLAVVEGNYRGPEGLIHHRLTTTGKVVKENDMGASSYIEVKILATTEDQSLLEVNLQEGRRHQIRVQLSLLGYPIWGDELYGAKMTNDGSFGLHCYRYQLEDDFDFCDDHFWGVEKFILK